MAQKPPSTFSRRILFWRMHHLLLRFLCLHEAAILALLVEILLTRFRSIFPGLLSICTSATAVAELFSSQWSAMEYHRCQPPCARSMRATTRTVSVSRVWVFCMHARRFMEYHFVKTSDSKPSALGLRFLNGSHPCFTVAHRRPPRPSVNLRPGVRMWSSRRWRASIRASPFLSLSHLSTCARVRRMNSPDEFAHD